MGRRGVISWFKWFLLVFATPRGVGRESAPCAINRQPKTNNQEPATTTDRDTQQSTVGSLQSTNPTSNNNQQPRTGTANNLQWSLHPTTNTHQQQTTIIDRDTQQSTVGIFTTNPTTNNKQQPPTGTSNNLQGALTTNPTTNDKQLPRTGTPNNLQWALYNQPHNQQQTTASLCSLGSRKTTLCKSRLYPPSQGLRIWLINCSLSRSSTVYHQSLL
jgi:hypothetical protein